MKELDYKCTNCGASLKINEILTVIVCEYCGRNFIIDKNHDKFIKKIPSKDANLSERNNSQQKSYINNNIESNLKKSMIDKAILKIKNRGNDFSEIISLEKSQLKIREDGDILILRDKNGKRIESFLVLAGSGRLISEDYLEININNRIKLIIYIVFIIFIILFLIFN